MAKHAHTTPDRRPEAALPSPARRSLFGGLAAAVMLPAVAPLATAVALEPDAVLLELCREFCQVCDQYDAIYDGPAAIEDDDAAFVASAPLRDRREALAERIVETGARSAAGIVAMAQALERDAGEGGSSFDFPGTVTNMLLVAIMRDAAVLGGRTPKARPAQAPSLAIAAVLPALPHSDAELIAASQEFCKLEREAQAVMNGLGDVMLDDPAYLAAEDEVDRRREPQAALMDRICSTTARTPEGIAAIAAAAFAWDQPVTDILVDRRAQLWGDRLQRALWRNAMARGVTA